MPLTACSFSLLYCVFSYSEAYSSISNLGPFRKRQGHKEPWEDVRISCLLKVWLQSSGCDEREGDPGKAVFGGFGACDRAPEVSVSYGISEGSRPQWKPHRQWE